MPSDLKTACEEAADKLERHAPHCTVTTAIAMRDTAAMLRKVGPLVEERDAYKAALEKYAAEHNWSNDWGTYKGKLLFLVGENGYDLAQQVLQEFNQ